MTGLKVQDKDGVPIHAGDIVNTPFRGGFREGEVEAIFVDNTTEPAEQIKQVHIPIKNPPKVVFTTQRGKQVAHNPESLHHMEKRER
ncbi:hypothetical protein JB92DRAFT_2017806 [Gautieria morchelliformis]|nr:hypothetical protein JB92DRAFT_2017806 [Gautieria morchelliformis]